LEWKVERWGSQKVALPLEKAGVNRHERRNYGKVVSE
jgi:hypothetical protein